MLQQHQCFRIALLHAAGDRVLNWTIVIFLLVGRLLRQYGVVVDFLRKQLECEWFMCVPAFVAFGCPVVVPSHLSLLDVPSTILSGNVRTIEVLIWIQKTVRVRTEWCELIMLDVFIPFVYPTPRLSRKMWLVSFVHPCWLVCGSSLFEVIGGVWFGPASAAVQHLYYDINIEVMPLPIK